MAGEAGNYAAECAAAQESTDALLCFLLVLEGNRGTNYSVLSKEKVGDAQIAGILRTLADQIDPPVMDKVNDWLVKEYEAAERERPEDRP